MTTRIIAVVLAAVLAIVGAVLLVSYVRGADERAFDGAELTEVLVVQDAIPAGSDGATLGTSVDFESVPVAYVARGAVTDLTQLEGLVSAVELVPGEQVLASRFVDPEDFGAAGGRVAPPEGMQEVSISVDVQRVVGGTVIAGDRVGIFGSLGADASEPSKTQLVESGVLVTGVSQSATSTPGTTQVEGAVLVTLAVSADQAQRVIYLMEFGSLWLSRQGDDLPAGPSGPATRGVFAG